MQAPACRAAHGMPFFVCIVVAALLPAVHACPLVSFVPPCFPLPHPPSPTGGRNHGAQRVAGGGRRAGCAAQGKGARMGCGWAREEGVEGQASRDVQVWCGTGRVSTWSPNLPCPCLQRAPCGMPTINSPPPLVPGYGVHHRARGAGGHRRGAGAGARGGQHWPDGGGAAVGGVWKCDGWQGSHVLGAAA